MPAEFLATRNVLIDSHQRGIIFSRESDVCNRFLVQRIYNGKGEIFAGA
jgi:hypothetical protein